MLLPTRRVMQFQGRGRYPLGRGTEHFRRHAGHELPRGRTNLAQLWCEASNGLSVTSVAAWSADLLF